MVNGRGGGGGGGGGSKKAKIDQNMPHRSRSYHIHNIIYISSYTYHIGISRCFSLFSQNFDFSGRQKEGWSESIE